MSEEVKNLLITLSLDILDISEKYVKMGTKEIDALVTNLVTGKKTGLIKKLYELEESVSSLRKAATKATLLSNKAESPSVSEKDTEPGMVQEEKKQRGRKPKEVVVEPKKEDKPKEVHEKKKETKEVKNTKDGEKQKEMNETKGVKDEEKQKEAKKKGGKKKEEPVKVESQKETVLPTEEVDTSKQEETTEEGLQPIHLRRKKIPIHIKTLVWNEYIGHDVNDNKCLCCKKEKINVRNFHCGHVIAESKGGDLTIKNLRPICAPCNQAMGTMSMNEFTKTFFGWEV
jgi:hypothetical protein